MNDMNERVALVTGGRAASEGHLHPPGAARGQDRRRLQPEHRRSESFAKEAGNNGLPVSPHQANVGNPATASGSSTRSCEYGRIDYLVNNAGAVHHRSAVRMSPLDWEQVIRVNLSGPFFMSQAVLPHFIERGFGRIVMISSYVGQVGRFGQANYAAAKSGQFGLTKALALETAAKGITVNCVVPGAIKTDMVAALPEDIVQAVIDVIPMHALGTPDDVAEAVRYLVSDEAHYLTGALIPVAGGLLMM